MFNCINLSEVELIGTCITINRNVICLGRLLIFLSQCLLCTKCLVYFYASLEWWTASIYSTNITFFMWCVLPAIISDCLYHLLHWNIDQSDTHEFITWSAELWNRWSRVYTLCPFYTHASPILQCIGPCNWFRSLISVFVYNTMSSYDLNKKKMVTCLHYYKMRTILSSTSFIWYSSLFKPLVTVFIASFDFW